MARFGILPSAEGTRARDERLRAMVDAHFDFVWRALRRMGVPEGDVEDLTQQAFLIASNKLDSIAPGRERAFVFGAALREASNARRVRGRRREVAVETHVTEAVADAAPSPDEVVERGRARETAESLLASMPLDLRTVLVLFEVEEMSTGQIAALLELPAGTVASRLRRAREHVNEWLSRARARDARVRRTP